MLATSCNRVFLDQIHLSSHLAKPAGFYVKHTQLNTRPGTTSHRSSSFTVISHRRDMESLADMFQCWLHDNPTPLMPSRLLLGCHIAPSTIKSPFACYHMAYKKSKSQAR